MIQTRRGFIGTLAALAATVAFPSSDAEGTAIDNSAVTAGKPWPEVTAAELETTLEQIRNSVTVEYGADGIAEMCAPESIAMYGERHILLGRQTRICTREEAYQVAELVLNDLCGLRNPMFYERRALSFA